MFSCFAVDFIPKKLSIFASCFIVSGARPIGLPKYYHQSEHPVLITSQLKLKLIPEQKVRRFEGRLSAESSLFETCVIGRERDLRNKCFQDLQSCGTGAAAGKSYVTSFSSSATFSCHELWLANVHTRSQHCKQHLPVCDAIATLLKNKSLTSSNKFIYIVTPVTIDSNTSPWWK